MKPRPSPFVTLQAPPHESPSHVPVHVALQSMKNLVDERITEITHHEFADLKKGMNNVKSSATSSTDKKRKIGEDEDSQIEVKRKKESRNCKFFLWKKTMDGKFDLRKIAGKFH